MFRHLCSRILTNALPRTQPATVICNGYMYPLCSSESQICHSRFQDSKTHNVRHMCMTILVNNCTPHQCNTTSRKSCLSVSCTPAVVQSRHKSNKRASDSAEKDEEEDSDIDDDELEENDFEAPPKFKVIKLVVASLRIDSIVSHALNIARNRMDEMFLGSSLMLNGEKIKKKAEKMEEKDYVDVIFEKSENQLKVKRVKLLKVLPEKTSSDKFVVKVRVWKTPFSLEAAKSESSPRTS
ncbi:mitochondrial transcription rescue factor 1 [Biomphalaria pfeifferi]|uniref:Mitochondrial transcription rescue factor 1 n=1 Tax=Biomphalaria pfeifferi TaxID=112525 RepID=A0AAD8EZA2_BIOPF|nr:mitochondrial transcription rescue factor 1 [Biomphalaria pfeifferi]